MSQTFRAAELWLIAVALGAVAVLVWVLGLVFGSTMLQYAGFMVGATTFLPLPADAYVLNVAKDNSALAIGIIGGLVNAAVVLVEREWVLRLARHPIFDRFSEFIGTNRWVDMAQRHMFVGLIVGGFSFLPFEPFRLVAVLRGYAPVRYAVATFLGRGFRYYWLARAGAVFAVYGIVKYVVWASLVFFAVGLIRSYLRFRSTAPEASS
ncbi:MAG: hypothetical protein ACRBK7_22735 [Acidimicrobiales bacterium]